MSSSLRILILSLVISQTISVFAQGLKANDRVQTPNYMGKVEEVINQGTTAEEVRVVSDGDIKTSAIYPSDAVVKIEGEKQLTARERRLQRALDANLNFTSFSLPSSAFHAPVGSLNFR